MSQTPAEMWESRYGIDDDVYGIEPNDFPAATVAVPIAEPGSKRALCLADGEGRNGMYLATLGYDVTSVDLTSAGMAKAAALADRRDVDLTTVVADLADYDLGTGRWDLIVSIFAHTPPPIRRRVHAAVATALTPTPTGTFVLEAYTPDQVGRGTGGPRSPNSP